MEVCYAASQDIVDRLHMYSIVAAGLLRLALSVRIPDLDCHAYRVLGVRTSSLSVSFLNSIGTHLVINSASIIMVTAFHTKGWRLRSLPATASTCLRGGAKVDVSTSANGYFPEAESVALPCTPLWYVRLAFGWKGTPASNAPHWHHPLMNKHLEVETPWKLGR